MEKLVYLVRHAEIGVNIDYLSKTEVEITEKGRELTEKFARNLKENFDIIFTSPSLRCRETSEIIARIKGLKVEIDPRLREVDFGIFEGLTKEEAKKKFPKVFEMRLRDKWNFRIPNGESYSDAARRLEDKGLVERYRGYPEDDWAQIYVLKLTERGRVIAAKILKQLAWLFTEFMQLLKKAMREIELPGIVAQKLEALQG